MKWVQYSSGATLARGTGKANFGPPGAICSLELPCATAQLSQQGRQGAGALPSFRGHQLLVAAFCTHCSPHPPPFRWHPSPAGPSHFSARAALSAAGRVLNPHWLRVGSGLQEGSIPMMRAGQQPAEPHSQATMSNLLN